MYSTIPMYSSQYRYYLVNLDSHPLTEAIAHTGRTYDEIGDSFGEQVCELSFCSSSFLLPDHVEVDQILNPRACLFKSCMVKIILDSHEIQRKYASNLYSLEIFRNLVCFNRSFLA